MGDAGDYRSSTRPGTTTHAGSDKDEVGALENLVELVIGLFGGAFPDARVTTSTHAAGQAFTDADFVVGLGHTEDLGVGIDGDELDITDAVFDHAVDSIGATATDTNDTNDGTDAAGL